jgi:hypothetical protein
MNEASGTTSAKSTLSFSAIIFFTLSSTDICILLSSEHAATRETGGSIFGCACSFYGAGA